MKRIARDELSTTPRKRIVDSLPFRIHALKESSGNEHIASASEHSTDDSQTQPITPNEPLAAFSHSQSNAQSPASLSTGLTSRDGVERAIYVCYGMVNEINCRLLPSARDIDVSKLGIVRHDSYGQLAFDVQVGRCIVSGGGVDLLQVNSRISDAMEKVVAHASVYLEAYVIWDDFLKAFEQRKRTTKGDGLLRLYVNIFGSNSEGDRVGVTLSADDVFLQPPLWQPPDVPYSNPHYIEFDSIADDDMAFEELALASDSIDRTPQQSDWSCVLNQLPQHYQPGSPKNNVRMNNVLLSHQLEALDFMSRRETEQLENTMRYWSLEDTEDGVPTYRHAVTMTESQDVPSEPRGGILADDMGLGKTLEAISLVANSVDRAASFAASRSQHVAANGTCLTRTKATLVIVPSVLLLEDWRKELNLHCKEGTLRVARYHGHDRARNFFELLDYDIVLTTYGTVTTECRKSYRRGREVLYSLGWFRIILDEAHQIRNQKTRQFNAVMDLVAQHHWCLTGTPISNTVQDVAALLRFCRIPLLQEPSCFRDHVKKPADRSFTLGCHVLRQTLSPICLRRTKELIDLPSPHLVEIAVDFSEEEKKHYSQLEAYSKRLMNASVSSSSKLIPRHTMLQAILVRRIFCNLGTYMRFGRGHEEELDADETLTLLEENNEASCSLCSSYIPSINQSNDPDSGALGSCSHILCALCFELTITIDGVPGKREYRCPVCGKDVVQQELSITQPGIKSEGQGGKHSSKLDRVIQSLLETQHREKSIVFSVWKKTIDVASKLCSDCGIAYVQIDGTVSQAERQRALDTFRSSATTSVLLMTLGTGALGLNLTAATRIHILEPQWNPTVEDQAIGRAVRIGQQQNATIIRYTVRNTVEQQVQSFQKRKKNIAAGGLGDNID